MERPGDFLEKAPIATPAGTGKAVGKNAAFEIAAEFALSARWNLPALSVIMERQPGGKVRLDQAVDPSLPELTVRF